MWGGALCAVRWDGRGSPALTGAHPSPVLRRGLPVTGLGLGNRKLTGYSSGSRGLSRAVEHFWRKRYYHFNSRTCPQFLEKLHYIHRNPVRRGLCERAEDWEWSSFRHYPTGCKGRVETESERAAWKQSRIAEDCV